MITSDKNGSGDGIAHTLTIHDVCIRFAVNLQIWQAASHSTFWNYIKIVKTTWQRYWACILILEHLGLVCAHSERVEDVGETFGGVAFTISWQINGNHGNTYNMFSHFIVAFRSLRMLQTRLAWPRHDWTAFVTRLYVFHGMKGGGHTKMSRDCSNFAF